MQCPKTHWTSRGSSTWVLFSIFQNTDTARDWPLGLIPRRSLEFFRAYRMKYLTDVRLPVMSTERTGDRWHAKQLTENVVETEILSYGKTEVLYMSTLWPKDLPKSHVDIYVTTNRRLKDVSIPYIWWIKPIKEKYQTTTRERRFDFMMPNRRAYEVISEINYCEQCSHAWDKKTVEFRLKPSEHSLASLLCTQLASSETQLSFILDI